MQFFSFSCIVHIFQLLLVVHLPKKKPNSAKELYEDCRTRKNPLFSNLQILPYEYDLIVQQSKLNFMHAIKFG